MTHDGHYDAVDRRWMVAGVVALTGAAAIAYGLADGDSDDRVEFDTGRGTSTTIDREAAGLNAELYCTWDTTTPFDLDEWSKTATPAERSEVEALLGGLPLSDFFIHATEDETRQACALLGGAIRTKDQLEASWSDDR